MPALHPDIPRHEESPDPQLPWPPYPGITNPTLGSPIAKLSGIFFHKWAESEPGLPQPGPFLSYLWNECSQPNSLSTGNIWKDLKFRNPNPFLFQHLQTHVAFRPYICNHCDAGFTSMSQLENHTRLHLWEKKELLARFSIWLFVILP